MGTDISKPYGSIFEKVNGHLFYLFYLSMQSHLLHGRCAEGGIRSHDTSPPSMSTPKHAYNLPSTAMLFLGVDTHISVLVKLRPRIAECICIARLWWYLCGSPEKNDIFITGVFHDSRFL